MAVEITSREELKAWLEDRPHDWAQAIALRSALRAFPFVVDPGRWRDISQQPQLILAYLRAIAVSSTVTEVNAGDPERLTAANAAVSSTNAIDVAINAATAASATGNASIALAATAAYFCAGAADAEMATTANDASIAVDYSAQATASAIAAGTAATLWRVASLDCTELNKGAMSRVHMRTPIWPELPEWWSAEWDSARKWLSGSGQGFEVWREWYYGRIQGLPHAFADFDDEADQEFYRWIVEQDDNWWSREPAIVNAEIKAYVDSLRKPKPPPTTDPKVDFFISYANANEAEAREIAAVLDDLGKSYLVQYRDFGPENFVNAMNDAMKRAKRIIPLYSDAYMNSAHCNAEWNYFYNLDPSSAERRIVSFLLEPCDLKPLMKQVVYKSLIDMKSAERKKAIREWIDWSPPAPTKSWAEGVLKTTISPNIVPSNDPANDNELVLEANAEFDSPQVPADLAEAYSRLVMLLDVVMLTTGNLSQTMQAALTRYRAEIEEKGLNSSWNGLDVLMSVFSNGVSEMDEREFHAGQVDALQRLIGAHNACITALRNADERMRDLQSIPVPELDQEASDMLAGNLEDIYDELKGQAKTSEELNEHLATLSTSIKDLTARMAHPNYNGNGQFTAKRLALALGSFAMGLLTAAGSIASISGTEVGVGIMAQLQGYIDQFFAWLRLT